MIKTISAALICLSLYGALIMPFTAYQHSRPLVERLGYVPSVPALKTVAADYKELVAATLVLKVMMYFGGLMEKSERRAAIAPDYMSMSRLLHGAVQVDPYNMDGYYFAQAFLTWDVRQYKVANDLLDHGMRYRTWDWRLPFYAGFNSAFFLKDYAAAARYYGRSGELGGPDLTRFLAGRYLQESGQTDLAIGYLSAMAKGERNPTLKKDYLVRLQSFREARRIEVARDRFRAERGSLPAGVEALVSGGYLAPPPIDPYGGEFYLEPDGRVATTSKFSYAGVKEQELKKSRSQR